MVRRTYHRGLRLQSGTQAAESADGPWLDDQTTSPYAARSLQRTAALPRFSVSPAPLVAAASPRSDTTEQRMDAALDSFWKLQSTARKAQIMSRRFDPTWVRVLVATLGIALGVTFGWVLVAGPELPTFSQKTKTLVPGINVAMAETPQPTAAEEPQPIVDIFAQTAHDTAPPTAAPSKTGSRRKRNPSTKVAAPLATQANARPATLRVDSRPGADVFIDDKAVGPTPQLSISLQPGVHNVRLHNRQLNLLKILTLHVLPGETIDRVEQLDP